MTKTNNKTGKLWGVPYDWRKPTKSRFLSRVWNPNAQFVNPRWWGWGYDLNFYKLFHPKQWHHGKQLSAGPKSLLVALVLGSIIGYLRGPALVLIPWAVVGLVIGILCVSRKAAVAGGGIYGFALAYAFMVSSYNGTDPLSQKLLPFVIFGLVGALCGAFLAILGFAARKLLSQ